MKIKLKILEQKIRTNFKLPQYNTSGDAGLDLCACIDHPIRLYPNYVQLIPTGIAIHIADPAFAAFILPRSGLGHEHGIVLGNLTGVIDSDYQGQILVSCWNRSDQEFIIQPKDRIAQMIIIPIVHAEFQVVNAFKKSTRSQEGFGSTGIK